MEIPERLHELIEQLGQAIMRAMAEDPESRELAKKIQEEGFDVALMVEATVALHRRQPEVGEAPAEPGPDLPPPQNQEEDSWSDEDRAFLRRFKISMD
ncbi:hypothetical protein [Holophaga foetida]|uniref:hypothetical protein n=1 Tax=Holophaga foetida TaxID=35839 RepID=UPI0002472AFF|nr:hypothetical protein [Holophaga foetida]